MGAELDISPLTRAIASLEAGLARHEQEPDDDLARDACTHRFKLAYAQYLRALTSLQARNAERRAFSHGDPACWAALRKARKKTSVAYEAAAAGEVFAVIPDFLIAGRRLSARLKP